MLLGEVGRIREERRALQQYVECALLYELPNNLRFKVKSQTYGV